MIGGVFAARLATNLAGSPGLVFDPHSLTPQAVAAASAPVRAQIAADYHDALIPVYLGLVPMMIAAGIWLLLIRSSTCRRVPRCPQAPRPRSSRGPERKPSPDERGQPRDRDRVRPHLLHGARPAHRLRAVRRARLHPAQPGLPDGPDAAVEGLEPKFQAEGARFEVQRILVDGDLAVVHLKASRPGAADTAVADFYRIRDGRLIEHWDVLQPVPPVSANDHPMF